MIPYKLSSYSDNRCGPLAVSAVTEKHIDEVLQIGWSGKFRGNDDDSFIHHKQAILNLGYNFNVLTRHNIQEGRFKNDTTLALMLTSNKSPLSYHWFILNDADSDYLYVWDGLKQTPIRMTWGHFKTAWGVMSVAYEIIPKKKDSKLGLLESFWIWITGLIKYRIWG